MVEIANGEEQNTEIRVKHGGQSRYTRYQIFHTMTIKLIGNLNPRHCFINTSNLGH